MRFARGQAGSFWPSPRHVTTTTDPAGVAAPERAARPPLGIPGVQPPPVQGPARERSGRQQYQPRYEAGRDDRDADVAGDIAVIQRRSGDRAEGAIHVRTVLPLCAPAVARTSPVRDGRPGGCQRASTQVVCTEVYGSGAPVAGACSSRTALTR